MILFYVWVKFFFSGSSQKALSTWFMKKTNGLSYIMYTIGMQDKTYGIKKLQTQPS
jgi:hypothetical protein